MGRSKSALEIDVVEDVGGLTDISDEWTALASVSGASQFSLPSFAIPWWNNMGRGALRVVTVRRKHQLVGLMPVHERNYKVGRNGVASVLRWLGHGLGVVGQMLVDPATDQAKVATAVWDALAEACSPRVALQLTEYRVGDAGLHALRHSTAWDPFLELRSTVPVVKVDDIATILAGTSRRSLRQTLSTAERDLEAGGHRFEFETVETNDHFRRVLPEIDTLFDLAEQHQPKMHMLRGDLRPMTLASIEQSLGSKHTLISILRVDGQPIAFDLSIVVNGTAYGFIRRHGPAGRDFSPGHLLMRHNLIDAHERGVDTFDLGLGFDSYKRRWATDWYDAVAITGGRAGQRTRGRATALGIDAFHQARSRLPSQAQRITGA